MRNIFRLNKNYFANGLVSRLFCQTLILLIIGGVLIREEMKDTYEDFTQKQVAQEFNLLAEKIYQLNEHALDEMLSNNRVISPVVLRIAQAKAQVRLTELLSEHNLLGAILHNRKTIYKNYQPKSVDSYHNGELIVDANIFLQDILFINQLDRLQINNTEYFIYKLDFKPWQWEIIFGKDSTIYDYKGVLFKKSIDIAIIITLLILSLATVSYFSIFLPIKKITESIEKLQPPRYKGIAEFEFLSQHINKTMQQLFASIKSAKKAEQIKADFLANMSHEIRTPLNAITGLTHLASQGQLPPHTQDYLSKIGKASHSLLHIVNDILDYSKIEAHKLVIDKHAFSLNELLGELIDLTVFDANHKNIEIIIIGQQNLPDLLYGDSLRIAQVLLNLLSNAIKFTQNGQILIMLEQQKVQGKTLSIKFTLQDTGIGISGEQLDLLFQPFSQADSSTTRQFGGTGLGLTICQRLVSLMGGQLHVASELGKGSCFYFELPLETQSSITDLSNTFLSNQDSQRKRLLIIESNHIARQTIVDIAEYLALSVTAEKTLQGALTNVTNTVSTHEYDFILIDNKFGEDDIFNFTQAIKESNSKHPYIILMTPELINHIAIQSHINARLQKPITPLSLMTKLQSLTNNGTPILSEKVHTAPSPLSGMNILAAEDNLLNQQVINELLSNAGAQVTLVENGLKAVEMVNQQNGAFDLILMDIHMPVLDGYQASEEIRKHYDKQRLPIIALSANTSQENIDRSKKFAINGYINKPFDPQHLLAVIGESCPDRIIPHLQSDTAPTIRSNEQSELQTVFPVPLLAENSSINITMAIKNVGGNATFLKKLLIQFYQNHYADLNKITQAVENNDIQSIQHIAHTLKGISATLGADDLFHSAQSIQKMSSKNPDQFHNMIDKLRCDLTLLLKQLLPLFDNLSMEKEASIATVNHINKNSQANNKDLNTLRLAFNTLDNALKKGVYIPKSQLEELQHRLQNTHQELNIKRLIKLVDNFEFERAHKALVEITTQLGIENGQK